jgi:hypothetical protein
MNRTFLERTQADTRNHSMRAGASALEADEDGRSFLVDETLEEIE